MQELGVKQVGKKPLGKGVLDPTDPPIGYATGQSLINAMN